MYHRKMEKQMCSVRSAKTPTLPVLFDDNKRSQSLPQVQAFNRLTLDRSMPTPRNKHLWHQRPHSSDATTIHLVPTDYVRETDDIQKTVRMHKLSAPWEGSFIVTEVISPSTYRLQWGDGQGVPNTWNVEHLRRFYP
jgi:hypothetical protein